MEQCEIKGKKYERTYRVLTLHALFDDAKACNVVTHVIWKFSHEFHHFKYGDYITLTKRVITYLKQNPGVIPWLIEKGYLMEVVEEKKQLPNQWYKGSASGDLYYSDFDCNLTRLSNNRTNLKVNWAREKTWLTPIPDPTITEQPEKRSSEKCHHLGRDDTCYCGESLRFSVKCREGDADTCGCHRVTG